MKLEVETVYTNEGRSLPVRGAWIEILRGSHADVTMRVAPRAGSVD